MKEFQGDVHLEFKVNVPLNSLEFKVNVPLNSPFR